MSPVIRVASYALLAMVAAVGGFLAYRYFTAPEPPPPMIAATARVPDVRPVFALEDATGMRRSITEWDGKSLVINFWATWCPPCRREIPMLNALHRDYATRGVEVVGIAVDFRETVIEYLGTTPVDYPVLIGEQEGLDVAKAFGMETLGFPFTIFTDSRGRIVTVHVGELHRPQADAILAVVGEVDTGRLTPAAARERVQAALAALKR